MIFYGTFLQNQSAKDGTPLEEMYVTIECETEAQAGQIMNAYFDRWGMLFREGNFNPKHYENGLYKQFRLPEKGRQFITINK